MAISWRYIWGLSRSPVRPSSRGIFQYIVMIYMQRKRVKTTGCAELDYQRMSGRFMIFVITWITPSISAARKKRASGFHKVLQKVSPGAFISTPTMRCAIAIAFRRLQKEEIRRHIYTISQLTVVFPLIGPGAIFHAMTFTTTTHDWEKG